MLYISLYVAMQFPKSIHVRCCQLISGYIFATFLQVEKTIMISRYANYDYISTKTYPLQFLLQCFNSSTIFPFSVNVVGLLSFMMHTEKKKANHSLVHMSLHLYECNDRRLRTCFRSKSSCIDFNWVSCCWSVVSLSPPPFSLCC